MKDPNGCSSTEDKIDAIAMGVPIGMSWNEVLVIIVASEAFDDVWVCELAATEVWIIELEAVLVEDLFDPPPQAMRKRKIEKKNKIGRILMHNFSIECVKNLSIQLSSARIILLAWYGGEVPNLRL